MDKKATLERLNDRLSIYRSPAHRFGTDAFLLADFSRPRKGETVCDLGTGCGIIPMLWLREEENAPGTVYGVEIQAEAVALLERTIAYCTLDRRILPVHGDLRKPLLPAASFDLVSCNPPYKKTDTGLLSSTQSDRIARHELACTLEDICKAAARLLRFGGRFCLCQRPERLADVFSAMRDSGLEPKRMRLVQQRHGQAPWLVLAEGRRGGRPHLTVEPPLLIEGNDGKFSQELLRIYRKV